MAPPNTEQTLWAYLGIASTEAKTKRKKTKAAKSVIAKKSPAAKRLKVVKAVNTVPTEKENTAPPEKEAPIVVPVICMQATVKYNYGIWTVAQIK